MGRKTIFCRCGAMGLLLVFLFTGCGMHLHSGNEALSREGILNTQIELPVQSMDPQRAVDGISFEMIGNITDGLTQPDVNGTAMAAIAQSWESSEDGLTWTFHLRKDAVWSKTGNAVTAKDFVYAWQRAVDPKTDADYAYLFSDVGQIAFAKEIINGELAPSFLGVEAPEPDCLRVHLNTPVPFLDELMMIPVFYPVERAFVESCAGAYADSVDTIQSNGAFCMEQYDSEKGEYRFVKNETYWDAGRIRLKELNYLVMAGDEAVLEAYQNGAVDYVTLSGDAIETMGESADLDAINTGYLWYLSVNMKVPSLENQNMRFAITKAVDRETLVATVLKDGSRAAYFAIPDEVLRGADCRDFRATAEPYYDVLAYDMKNAQTCFEAAKGELGEKTFTFTLLADDTPQTKAVAEFLQEHLERILPGVQIEPAYVAKEERLERLKAGDYEIALARWGADYSDPTSYLNNWRSGNRENYGGWRCEEYDRLLEDAARTQNAQVRWGILQKAEKIAMENVAVIPLYEKRDVVLVKPYVGGIETHAIALNHVYKNAFVVDP